jgi:hypothetical protein
MKINLVDLEPGKLGIITDIDPFIYTTVLRELGLAIGTKIECIAEFGYYKFNDNRFYMSEEITQYIKVEVVD